VAQAQRLGAEVLVPVEVMGVTIREGYKHLSLSDGRQIVTRTLAAATGMEYRQHPAAGIPEHTGAGVYYGAAATEAPAFAGRRVLVVGAGNSAGQAAMYLSRYAAEVQIVIRRESLLDTMSRYLIDQIEKTPNITVRTRTELERVAGDGRVERVVLTADGASVEEPADAVFVFIGTKPRSEWLPAEVLRDAKGFVLTGRDLLALAGHARVWKERREPMTLETSAPGVFAAGDIRAGAMNRVASAVGEGSMMVRFAHEYLALT
jgi:thioredoxin reductase (NADPH)